MLVMLAGLPGTGKSTVARALAREVGGVVLDKDQVRAALFPPERIEYSTEQDDFCVGVMLQAAAYLLARNPAETVLLDGRTFSRARQVEQVEQFAARLATPLAVIECVCDDQTARRRLEGDLAGGAHLAGNRDYRLYQAIKARFEPIREPKLLLDTDAPTDVCVAACLDYLAFILPSAKR